MVIVISAVNASLGGGEALPLAAIVGAGGGERFGDRAEVLRLVGRLDDANCVMFSEDDDTVWRI